MHLGGRFRRGLEEDHVIAPYASILAVALRPQTVVANLAKLASRGRLGTCGFFDALDQRDKALVTKDLFVDVDAKTRDLVLPGVEYRMRFLCSGRAERTDR